MSDSTPDRVISSRLAFRAMAEFIAAHYARARAGDVATLLADIELQPDGQPGDPAAWDDWVAAIDRATAEESS